jgi:hypothetical protein
VDPPVPGRRVRRVVPVDPAGRHPDRRAAVRPGRRVETGEPGTDRRPGDADPAGLDGVGAVGINAAAAFPPPGADGPGRRGRPGGVRPVRGRLAERAVGRRRPARPEGRRPEGLPVRVPGRPLQAGGGVPVRVRRGHRAVGRRVGTRVGRPRRPRIGVCGQRVGVRRRMAAPGVRETRDPAGPQHPSSTPRTRENRKILAHGERSVPRRGRRQHRRRHCGEGHLGGGGVAGAERVVHRVGGNRLPPSCAFRDRADPAGQVDGRVGHRRARPGHGPNGCVDRGVPVVRAPNCDQNRDGVVARQHLPDRTRARRPEGRVGVLPVQPRTHRRPLPRQELRESVAASHHPARPPQGPTRNHRTRTGPGHRDRLPGHGRRHAPPAGRGRRDHQFRRPLPPPDALRPDGQLPGQLSIDDILGGTVDPADRDEATG